MHSLPTALRLWLKAQSQAISGCTNSLLVGSANVTTNSVESSTDKSPRDTDDVVKAATRANPYQILAKWSQGKSDLAPLSRLAQQVLSSKKLQLLPLNSHSLLLAKPVEFDGKLWGVVVLKLHNPDNKAAKPALMTLQAGMVWLQFLVHQAKGLAVPQAVADAPARAQPLVAPQAYWLHLGQSLLQENSLRETAISLVNLLATQTKAARVSLSFMQGRDLVLEAVSFSANFDVRTQAMRALVEAMHEAVDQAQDVFCSRQEALVDGQVQRCHQILLEQQQLNAVQTILLRKEKQKDKAIFGVITLEYVHLPEDSAAQTAFVRQSLSLAGPIFSLQTQVAQSVGAKVRQQAQGFLQRTFGEERLLGKLVLAGALLFCALMFIPAQYWVGGDANLQPANKYLLVSPQDGFLSAIKARPGDDVKKGALLAQLNDDDLRLERRKLSSEVKRYQQAYDNALATSNRVDAAIASAQADQARIQLQLIEQQLGRTQLLAPADGVVVSKDISQALGAPVKQGEVLFEIATEGYVVQLWVGEQDIGDIATGQEGKLKLSSLPGEVLAFSVSSITPLNEVRSGRNYFQIEAALADTAALLRPGMSGSGKVAIGARSLGWIWFHQAWRWVRLNLWW